MRALKYFAVFFPGALVFLAFLKGDVWTYLPLIVLFLLFPILELLLEPSDQNMLEHEEMVAKEDWFYDLILFLLVPMQYGLLVFFLYQIGNDMAVWERFGMILSMGIACGILGINAAHELGHRKTKFEQFLGKFLLLSSLNLHFFIEHNRGHHKNVSTYDDPASSRYGESVYFFWLRSIVYSYISAWKLENTRLALLKRPFWSLHNEMLRFQIIQGVFLTLIFFIFGWSILFYFIAAAFFGAILLGTVNYIEHYGLRRKKVDGKYERTMPIHSWNSNHPLGRLVLMELSRHSDHHYLAHRKYQILRHHNNSPQMPTGYPGMMLLSLIPPLWFKVMHQKISEYRDTLEGRALD